MPDNHIFISYDRRDSRFAETLGRILDDADLPIWRDPDIRAGETWRGAIDDAIRESSALVVIMSPESRTSAYLNYEWAFALGVGVTVVPVLLRLPPEQLHPCLADRQALDFTDPLERDWTKLVVRLKQLSKTSRRAPRDAGPIVPTALENAARCINSIDAAERFRAIETLKQMNDPGAKELLAGALQHPVRDVRVEAAFALAGFEDLRCIPKLLEAAIIDFDHDSRFYRALNRIGPTAVPELARCFEDSKARIREKAIRAVHRLQESSPDPVLLPALTHALGDSDDGVRSAAVETLGPYGDAAPIASIVERLADESWHVRREAAIVLGDLGGLEGVHALTTVLTDESDEVRFRAIESLATARNSAAVPALIETMRRKVQDSRHAAEALGKIGDPAAVPALADAVRDLGYTATDALAAIGGPEALAALRAVACDPKNDSRESALRGLTKVLGAVAIPELISFAQDADPGIRFAAAFGLAQLNAPEAIPVLIPFLADPDCRSDATLAFEHLGSPAVPALVEALKDGDAYLRSSAQFALERIGGREARAALKAFRRGASA